MTTLLLKGMGGHHSASAGKHEWLSPPDIGERASANSGAPSALIAYGENNVEALEKSGLHGSLLKNWNLQ